MPNISGTAIEVRLFLLVSAVFLALVVSPARAQCDDSDAAVETCELLDSCMVRLRAIAQAHEREKSRGMGEQQCRIAERIRSLPGAVDALIPLLADPDIEVAELAAYVLRDVESIDPRHLPQVKAGLDRKLGWLPPALARMDNDEAAREAVARLLVSDSAPQNQYSYAVELVGARAIPHVVSAARCTGGCKSSNDHYYLGYALGKMGAKGAAAVPGLLEIAEDRRVSDAVAIGAVMMIADLEKHARPWQDRISALASQRPSLAPAVKDILVEIRSDQAGEIMNQRLRQSPDVIAIRDTAALGARGAAAAPALATLLASDDWKIRVHAARALGFIGEVSVTSALIEAMLSPTDVNLNWAAAVSLGRLRVPASAIELERVAGSHWHPAVRKAAARALANVRAGGPAQTKSVAPMEFFMTLSDYALDCETPRVEAITEPESQKIYVDQHQSQIARLQYPAVIVGYGPSEGTLPDASEIIKITPNNVVRHEQRQLQIPDVALRMDGGWLVGSDRGEWGGELAYIGDDGNSRIVFEQNIDDIFRLGDKILVVSGVAHMMSNEGMVYRLTRGPGGGWLPAPWRALPGAPKRSRLTSDGRVLVNTFGGGAVLIDAQGGMSMAACAP